ISWPSGSEVNLTSSNSYLDNHLDPPMQQITSGGIIYYVPVYFVQTTPKIVIPAGDLPEGQQLYVNYRAVNNQGKKSSVRSSGPVAIDNQPPGEHSVSQNITYNYNVGRLIAHYLVEDISDPVSGVIKVEMKVTQGSDVDTGWVTVEEYDVARQGTFSISGSSALSLDFNDPASITVWARVTNGVHLQRVRPLQVNLQLVNTTTTIFSF
ncbi:MAG: hypothetical protein R6U28_03645, partial [Cyclonatronaceae bacterium]